MAFLFKQASLASFVLTFLKEGDGQQGFYKRLKHRRPVAFLLNKASLASFVSYFLKEGDGQVGFHKKYKTKEACGVPF